MEKEINGKVYQINEITYQEGLEISELNKSEGSIASIRKLVTLSTGMSDEEFSKLSMRDGKELQKLVNEVNDLGAFQKPAEDESQN